MDTHCWEWDRFEDKKLRINNGSEYEDIIFKTFFYEHEIRMERTILGMP